MTFDASNEFCNFRLKIITLTKMVTLSLSQYFLLFQPTVV